MTTFLDIILHLDTHLSTLLDTYGATTTWILIAIVFCETGLVILPFLPGDSLLFAAGALAARPGSALSIELLFIGLTAAAILGNTVNYNVGSKFGTSLLNAKRPLIKAAHIAKTQAAFQKHGSQAIILTRFIPILRTIAPFVAGVSQMALRRFVILNVIGGSLWVGLLLGAGFLFGGLPLVRDNFSVVVLAIIGISFLPVLWEILKKNPKNPPTI